MVQYIKPGVKVVRQRFGKTFCVSVFRSSTQLIWSCVPGYAAVLVDIEPVVDTGRKRVTRLLLLLFGEIPLLLPDLLFNFFFGLGIDIHPLTRVRVEQ